MRSVRLCLLLAALVFIAGNALGCAAVTEAGAFFAARDMRDAIANAAELMPSGDMAAVYYDDINGSEYKALNDAMFKFEQKQKMSVLRLFAVEENKCFFVSEYQGNKNNGEIFLYSIGTDGKNCELIKAFDEGRYVFDDEFGGDYTEGIPVYPDTPAYYYHGSITVNTPDKVYEYDIASGNMAEYAAADYAYPEYEYGLSYRNGVLYAERGGKSFHVTVQELIESSPEMKYLYELTCEQRGDYSINDFFGYFTYYDGEPYIVCSPMSKYGYSFGALFRFEPETKKAFYIDCIFTNDIPHCVYPIIVCE